MYVVQSYRRGDKFGSPKPAANVIPQGHIDL